jgi:hypothetical protein
MTSPRRRNVWGRHGRILVVDDNQSELDLSDLVLAGAFDRRQVAMYFATSCRGAELQCGTTVTIELPWTPSRK